MNTLFAKLSLALLVIVLLIGSGFFFVERFSTRLYHEEITQRLNASIAMYVTGERQLMENGVVNDVALSEFAQQAMIINPTVEVYLLDTQGGILAHAMPAETVLTQQVDLAPVRALMGGKAEMSVHGTDPRNLDRKKVFSAHPVMFNDQIEGYLYAVLGGQKYDELADSIRVSYIQKLSLGAMVAIVLGAFMVGLLVFGLLTRRLSGLTSDVQAFTRAGFDPELAIRVKHGKSTDPKKSDEISQLREAFAVMADKIREQFERLKETDRLRRELVSNVSHDLRTPLASMHAYVETLLIKNESFSADERRHHLEITRKHTKRLGQLIGDLFELSKLEAASVQPSLEYFSLAELLQDVAQEFELEAQKLDISLSVESARNAPAVSADIGLMQRVLENLIRNALKYTPRGGNVTISLQEHPGHVAVAVADTGRGIAQEDLERVFDRFYRGHDKDDHEGGSAGLGLAIVRKILDLHGSRITVSSELNQGTCFEFELPTRAAA